MQAQMTKIPLAGLAAAALVAAAAWAQPLVSHSGSGPIKLVSAHLAIRPQKPVLGVDLYAQTNYSGRVVGRDGPRDLTYIRHTLGAASVGIAWNFFSPKDFSNTVRATGQTLAPAHVAYLTRRAKADHLSVEYRPLIKVQHGSQWDGYISPPNQARWFANYYRTLLPYLRVAQRLHVGEFVVETELERLNSSSQWPRFLRRVRRVYHGVVSYAALGTQYYPRSRHLLPVWKYGVTAYPNMNLPDSARIPRLVQAWKQVFASVPAGIRYRTAIDETGIPALDGAYHNPARWARKGHLNETVQARFFSSECVAVKDLHLRAIYFWNVNLNDDPLRPPFPSPTTFEGKKGAKAIRGCARLFR
jgi:hypothetical protein